MMESYFLMRITVSSPVNQCLLRVTLQWVLLRSSGAEINEPDNHCPQGTGFISNGQNN